jgi:hypothetical protein
MLILTLRCDESVTIGEVRVLVVHVEGRRATLGIAAAREIPIRRERRSPPRGVKPSGADAPKAGEKAPR